MRLKIQTLQWQNFMPLIYIFFLSKGNTYFNEYNFFRGSIRFYLWCPAYNKKLRIHFDSGHSGVKWKVIYSVNLKQQQYLNNV